jgi:hypothetical protein
MLSSHLLAITAQMLATNGLDLWDYRAAGGENLRLPFSFYAPIYSSMDATAQGGFFRGEQERMTLGGDSRAIFEIAAARYPRSRHREGSGARGPGQRHHRVARPRSTNLWGHPSTRVQPDPARKVKTLTLLVLAKMVIHLCRHLGAG